MIDSLPSEVLDHIFTHLVGVELLALPSVNRALHRELEHDLIWGRRLGHATPQPSRSSKAQYLSATSMRFIGDYRGGALPLASDTTAVFTGEKFSIDVWLSLGKIPSGSNVNIGGVVLGAQSTSWMEADQSTPESQLQLIHVDNQCNLYCSVTNKAKTPVAKLAFDRWYHITITFNHSKQRVYLDGQLIRMEEDAMHQQWETMKSLQFGSGFMGIGLKGSPSPEFSGWYGFTGLLETPRVWGCELSTVDIKALSQAKKIEDIQPVWPPQDESVTPLGNAQSVKSTRPLERHCIVPSTDETHVRVLRSTY